METLQTALMIQRRDASLKHAMHRLLDKLKDFVRVYGRTPEDEQRMPDHDIVWVVGAREGESPQAVILQALKSHPELWLSALPDGVCIVPRAGLDSACNNLYLAEDLRRRGLEMVETNAARTLQKIEVDEYAQRRGEAR